MTEEEKQIVETAPDYENQLSILEEEHEADKKKRKWYALVIGILLFIVIIFIASYAHIYIYRPYRPISPDNCENVNIKTNGSLVPNINIYKGKGKKCKPEYNIDYYNNRKATFNIDLFGDGSYIFNKVNQKDASGKYCILNCDKDDDGWPDYNIDLNGDGIADINIVLDPKNNKVCDRNCDINFDTIPDTNIYDETNNYIINKTVDDYKKPIYNIDYMGNKKPIFNVDVNGDKSLIKNPMNQMDPSGSYCVRNCDIDNDGWPDYNITLSENGVVLNELIESGSHIVSYIKTNTRDWKCNIVPDLKGCTTSKKTNTNKYINIDVDGDGIPDVNISNDKGKNIINELNKEIIVEGKKIILNYDKDNDGFPDLNIDLDNDNNPDLNITKPDSFSCLKNCDYNNDGKRDYNIDITGKEENLFYIGNINIDLDYDGKCDLNCDKDGDLIPDYNIDTTGDKLPNINIDYDGDYIPDYNIDINNDGYPDENIDIYGTGKCNFNCLLNGIYINKVNDATNGKACNRNCDTDGDGLPDKYVYINSDDTSCSFNCGTDETKDDDNNYYLDSETVSKKALLEVIDTNKKDVYVLNPVDIYSEDVEPGWNDKYVLEVKNTSNYAIKYRIYWDNITNEFTDENNLVYNVTRNGSKYIIDNKAPRQRIVLKDNLILKDNSSFKYVLDINFIETNVNQNIDSGKNFKGQLKVDIIKK